MNTFRACGLVAALSIVSLSMLARPSFANPWTSVGSAGIVDESDTELVDFNNGIASTLSSAPAPSTLNLRYNIVLMDSLVEGGTHLSLQTRYRDNGSGAQVRLKLKSYGLFNGLTNILGEFDSNTFSSSSNYQWNSECFDIPPLDLYNYAYFLDVELIKSSTSGTPSLGVIQLERAYC